MNMASAGRILIMPKGNYDAKNQYAILDLVTYNNAAWLARKATIGIEPSDDNHDAWQKLIDLTGISAGQISDLSEFVDNRIKNYMAGN